MAKSKKNKGKNKAAAAAETKAPTSGFVFGKKNYRIMILGILVIVAGFALMSGGPGTPEEIYSFRRITLAPIVVLAGFAIQVWAIMAKTDNASDDGSN